MFGEQSAFRSMGGFGMRYLFLRIDITGGLVATTLSISSKRGKRYPLTRRHARRKGRIVYEARRHDPPLLCLPRRRSSDPADELRPVAQNFAKVKEATQYPPSG